MWRRLCLAHGIRGCHSTPVLGEGGLALASFFLCFEQARGPDEWERRGQEALAQSAEELSRFNRAMVGRELRRIELKRAINLLRERLGEPPAYALRADWGSQPSAGAVEARES